jgi:bacillithiol biosynthesis cysteine-adding enzyme BshC
MTVSTGSPAARATPSTAEGFHGDWMHGREPAVGFLPRHPSREADWTARVHALAGRPPASAVWARARADAERLGAGAATLRNADALADGSALCVATGQQPGLFLGPLYSLYKAMTAVVLARDLQARLDRPVVPVFWNAADDSDFGEVAQAHLAGDDFRLVRVSLDGGELPAGGMVGNLSVDGTRAALAAAPAAAGLRALERALDRAADHGELAAALLYDLLGETGLVIVDGRWRELRQEASSLFVRYAGKRAEVTEAVNAAGARLKAAGYRARISPESADHALFILRDGIRLPFPEDDTALARAAAEAPESLSPNVVLRPLVQDSLLPNLATVGGPGEISYHAQLAPVYECLDVDMPVLFPRFEATLVPSGVVDLVSRRGGALEDFVRDFDAAMQATADAALPAPLRGALADLDAAVADRLDALRTEAESFDGKLVGTVDDAGKRIADATGKIRQKLAKAARATEAERDPNLGAYREFLRPRGVPQERVLSALSLFLESTTHPLDCLAEPLARHLESARAGRPEHWLLPLGGCREADA